MKKIKIIVGHFGSGKTEVAVNLAAHHGKGSAIVDMDTVNPYFRTADAKKQLEEMGVRVIVPEYANTNVDIPSLGSEIFSVFASDEENIIFDVGGDDDGAIALGMFNPHFAKHGYEMYFVVNKSRPLTSNADDTIELMRNIEAVSRLKVTGLINSTHLAHETTEDIVLSGQELTEEISKKTGLSIVFTSVKEELAEQIRNKINNPVLGLHLYINLPFARKDDNLWQR